MHIQYLERCLVIYEIIVGCRNPNTAQVYTMLGMEYEIFEENVNITNIYCFQEKGLDMFKNALTIFENVFDKESPHVARINDFISSLRNKMKTQDQQIRLKVNYFRNEQIQNSFLKIWKEYS